MGLLLFGFWDVPLSSYLIPYIVLAIIGFALGYLNRYLLIAVIPVVLWVAIQDVQSFYRSSPIGPDKLYMLTVVAFILGALGISVSGAVLGRNKTLFGGTQKKKTS